MNISTNLKAIDMIKGEILSEIAHLYFTELLRTMTK